MPRVEGVSGGAGRVQKEQCGRRGWGGLIDKRIAGGRGGATTMAGAADQRLRRRLRTGSEVQAGGTKGAARPKTATSACSQTAEAGGGHGSTKARVGGELQAVQDQAGCADGLAWVWAVVVVPVAVRGGSGLCSDPAVQIGSAATRRDETVGGSKLRGGRRKRRRREGEERREGGRRRREKGRKRRAGWL